VATKPTSTPEVNRIERGRRNPGLLTIIKLAKALDVPAGDLLAGL
jgi:transcriptional regulator with XRE-family HTH domain